MSDKTQLMEYYAQEREAAKGLEDETLVRELLEELPGDGASAANVVRARALVNEARVRGRRA